MSIVPGIDNRTFLSNEIGALRDDPRDTYQELSFVAVSTLAGLESHVKSDTLTETRNVTTLFLS